MQKLAVLVVLLVALPSFAGTSLVFQIPQGWVDCSPTAPYPMDSRLDSSIINRLRDPASLAAAIDLNTTDKGFRMNMNARLAPFNGPVDLAVVKQLSEVIAKEVKRSFSFTAFEVRSTEVLKIGGVNCGKFWADVIYNGRQIRQMAYLIPDGTQVAVLTFTGTVFHFENYLYVMNDAAFATRGIRACTGKGRMEVDAWVNGTLNGALRGGLIGLLVGILGYFFRAQKPPADQQVARQEPAFDPGRGTDTNQPAANGMVNAVQQALFRPVGATDASIRESFMTQMRMALARYGVGEEQMSFDPAEFVVAIGTGKPVDLLPLYEKYRSTPLPERPLVIAELAKQAVTTASKSV